MDKNTKTFGIYSCYFDENCMGWDITFHSKVNLSVDDFVDEFDFNYLDEFDEPSKHNKISRLLTDSAIEKHNLDRYMYIGCYNN